MDTSPRSPVVSQAWSSPRRYLVPRHRFARGRHVRPRRQRQLRAGDPASEAQWDNAAPLTVNNGLGIIEYSVSTDDTGEAEAAVVLQNADIELGQAAEAFSEVELAANPYEGTAFEEFYTPAVVEAPSAEDAALVAALDDAEQKLEVVEALLNTAGTNEAEVDKANASDVLSTVMNYPKGLKVFAFLPPDFFLVVFLAVFFAAVFLLLTFFATAFLFFFKAYLLHELRVASSTLSF